LIEIHAVVALRRKGISLQAIRRALPQLRRDLRKQPPQAKTYYVLATERHLCVESNPTVALELATLSPGPITLASLTV
jgi:hypothetical protein